MTFRPFAAVLVLVAISAAPAAASNCPVLTQPQLACQAAVTKAGGRYAKAALKTIERCLLSIQKGKLTGDPATVCLGQPPSDQSTADKLSKASDKLTLAVPKGCSDGDAALYAKALLDTGVACDPSATGLATCVVSNIRRHVVAAATTGFGAVVASTDQGAQKCQKAIGKEASKYLLSKLKAVAQCLDERNAACGSPDPVTRCLAPQSDGPTPETDLLAAVARADGKLRGKIGKVCTDAQVAALHSCGNTVMSVEDCLVCSHGNDADLIAGDQYRNVRVATPVSTLAAAVGTTEEEDTVLMEPGSYVEGVTLTHSGLTVRGIKDCTTGARAVLTPPDPGTLYGIQHCGSRLPGCTGISDNVVFQGFEADNYLENNIYDVGVDGVTYRDIVARGPGMNGRARYGIFPVQSHNVLVEKCLVTGISDAGIYVGQSDGILVRNNEVHDSVAGIEIENSANAEVHDNYTHDNAGGILVFKLPGLPVQLSNCHFIHDNTATGNNGPNYGSGTVGLVPPGTGMITLSNDSGIVQNNTVTGNKSIGFAIVDQVILNAVFAPPPFPMVSADEDVNDNAVVGNTITGNGFDPDSAVGAFAGDVVFLPVFKSGNCQSGNTYATDFGAGLTGLPVCPGTVSPRPGCPLVVPTTTTTTSPTTTTTTTTFSGPAWTFAAQVAPLLSTHCSACHGGSGTPQYAGLTDLDVPALAYAHIVGVPSTELMTMDRITPGDHANSYLWNKINGSQASVGGSGSRMPQGGPFLSAGDIAGVASWIDAGALNN
jgi:parallel beta-helix repeat protein